MASVYNNDGSNELSEEMSNALDALVVPDYPSIQEAEFVKFFLPLFVSRERGDRVDMGNWLYIAKHPHNPVNVMDGHKVLYQVPAMMTDAGLNSTGLSTSVAAILHTAALHYTVMPSRGNAFMQQHLTNRVAVNQATLSVVNQWNSIFERYGAPLIQIPEVLKEKLPGEVTASESRPNDKPTFDTFEEF
jgi:hypothetical protein